MTPQELVDTARQAVLDWDDGRPEGMTGQAWRDVVAGLLDVKDQLVVRVEEAKDRVADLALDASRVLAERGEEIAALTAERDRLAAQVQRIRDYADVIEEVEGGDGWQAIVLDLRRALDGGAS